MEHANQSPYKLEVFTLPLWFLPESGHSCGIKFGRQFCQINIPGTINSGIETGMVPGLDRNGIWRNAIILIKYGNLQLL